MDTKQLLDNYRKVDNDLGSWKDQADINYNTRYCIWAPQYDDGRKHDSPSGRESTATPWDGASDLRTFIIDELIISEVALLVNALFRANIVAMPVESGDIARSRLVGNYMKWRVFSQMEEFPREADLIANYFCEKGIGAVGVFWDQEVASTKRNMSAEELSQLAPQLIDKIINPDLFEDAVEEVRIMFPSLSRPSAKRFIEDMRENGNADYVSAEILKNGPVMRAFSLDLDLLIPIDVTDIQKAPYIFRIEYCTAETLKQKMLSEDLDESWVTKVIESGKTTYQDLRSKWDAQHISKPASDLYKIIYAYWKEVDKDGIVTVNCSVLNESVPDSAGKQEMLDYRPARYPFVIFPRERLSRRIFESRGMPEVAQGWQEQIKIERDTRIDRATMTTCPPIQVPGNRPVANFGPARQVPTSPGGMGEIRFMNIPPGDGSSLEVEANVMRTMRRYFGRATGQEDIQECQQIQSANVRRWLQCWVQVFRHVWQLCIQFGPDQEFFRVLGDASANPVMFVKGDSNEKYDFYLDFDVINNDYDKFIKNMETIGEVIAKYDVHNTTDKDMLLKEFIMAINPTLGQKVIQPVETASKKEEDDEKDLLTKIWSGMDVDVNPMVNAQLRLSVIQNYLQGSQAIPATDVQQRMQSDKSFQSRMQKHIQQLQFVIQQRQNAEIGKLGTKPGNM